MPVTPEFSLRQDAAWVLVEIRVPFVRVSDASLEYVIDGPNLSFFVKPYLLKLCLPHAVMDDDRTKAQYDPTKGNGTVTLHLPKAVEGQHFEDLDLLTQLQQPRQSRRTSPVACTGSAAAAAAAAAPPPPSKITDLDKERRALQRLIDGEALAVGEQGDVDVGGARPGESAPLIEVVSSVDFGPSGCADEAQAGAAAGSSAGNSAGTGASVDNLAGLFAKTELLKASGGETGAGAGAGASAPAPAAHVVVGAPRYGFCNQMTGFFKDIRADFPELVELDDPDATPPARRRELRVADEDAAFDKERFVSDFVGADEDPIFVEAMRFRGHLPADGVLCNEEAETPGASFFSPREVEQMRALTNREFLPLAPRELRRTLCSVLDVVVAYCYDQRTTQGDASVESAWTLRILSPTLAWLDDSAEHPRDVLVAAMHRMLAYPYLRHLALAATVLEDAALLLQGGKRALLKALLGIHRVMQRSDQYYLLNRLFLTDMCVWVQQVDAAAVAHFCEATRDALGDLLAKDPEEWLRFDLALDDER